MTITPYRRHSANCPHKSQRAYKKCRCPMWLERWDKGNGFRKSAKTRSWEGQKLARAEEDRSEQTVLGEKPEPVAVTVEEAAKSFLDTQQREGLNNDPLQRHGRMTALLLAYCRRESILYIAQVTLPHLPAPRAEWYNNLDSKV